MAALNNPSTIKVIRLFINAPLQRGTPAGKLSAVVAATDACILARNFTFAEGSAVPFMLPRLIVDSELRLAGIEPSEFSVHPCR